MSDTTKVTFAYDYTDESGKDHKPDSTAALPAAEARLLIHEGRARAADTDESGPAKRTSKRTSNRRARTSTTGASPAEKSTDKAGV